MAVSRDDLELEQIRANIEHMRATITKTMAETAELHNETTKLSKEIRWYEVVIVAGITAAVIGATAAFTKIFL